MSISKHLHASTTSLYVAQAFFTDHELIELLAGKARAGIDVQVIISDNPTNRDIDYSSLLQSGGQLMRYPRAGYGGMQHKFCVIDEQLVINGSYNWTVNARKNNSENVQISEEIAVVEKFIGEFTRLRKNFSESETTTEQANNYDIRSTELLSSTSSEIEAVDAVDEWISKYLQSTVLDFDRNELKEEGESLAKASQGNPEMLDMKLDSVYEQLLRDTEIDPAERDRLERELKNLVISEGVMIDKECERRLALLSSGLRADEADLEQQIVRTEYQKSQIREEEKTVDEVKISECDRKIESTQEKINKINLDQTPQPFPRRLIPEILILGIVSLYLVVFYSSIIYTIMYGREDAMEFLSVYGTLPEVEIFNAEAISLAWERGSMTFSFIMLFTSVPILIGLLYVKMTGWKRILCITAPVMIDIFLAYLIAKNVYNIDYQAGRVSEYWDWVMIFSSARFYTILMIGALPYVLWGFLLENIYSQFNALSRSVNHNRNVVERERLTAEIEALNVGKADLGETRSNLRMQQIDMNSKQAQLETRRTHLKNQSESKQVQIEHQTDRQKLALERRQQNISDSLNRNRIPVNISALRSRIDILMGGWSEWLYREFSATKADEKVKEGRQVSAEWLDLKKQNLV